MSPEKRLVYYRCALVDAANRTMAEVEDAAHQMLAAERPVVSTTAPADDLPRIEWRHAACTVSVCRLSTRALVLWGDVHRSPTGWIARCDVEQIDGAFTDLGAAYAAVEAALRARLAMLTGAA